MVRGNIRNLVRAACRRVLPWTLTRGLWGLRPTQACMDTCTPLQEAILLGVCLERFGALDRVLYETMMARLERRQHAAPSAL